MIQQPSSAVRYLRDFIAIPSVNPMGRQELDPSILGERRYATHLQAQLSRLGVDAVLVGEGERCSVVAEVTAAGAKDTVMVASHLDTVPVDGMRIAPFDPVLGDGRVQGRGACDTKAGMAALVAALERVLARGKLRRNLVLVGEADEELSSIGVRDVMAHLAGRRPDWVIATEPTELRLVNRHKGIALVRLEARGRAAHSSNPSAGRNAITALAKAIVALERLGVRLSERRDAQLGSPTLSVGVVGGGHAPNIVPHAAWALVDRRMLPEETAESVKEDILAAFRADAVPDVSIASCQVEKDPLETAEGHPVVQRCRYLLDAAGLEGEPTGVAFGTDAGPLSAAGIPAVVLGPGSIAQAHTDAEYVEVAQVDAMTDLFVALLESDA